MRIIVSFIVAGMACLAPTISSALEVVTFRRDGQLVRVTGEVVTEAVDGGVLVRDRANVFWAVTAEELEERREGDGPYTPLGRTELAAELLEEFPDFRIHNTANYLIVHNTSPAYAQWCGALYERLYRAFRNFWQRRGFEFTDPRTPLVALVFNGPESYRSYARQELGEAVESIPGYYSLMSNRVTMYDLTGTQAVQPAGGRRLTSTAQINRVLSQPQAEFMVATIIHEATHQLAYNCGFHQRFADVPLWVAEGLAMYFETPDLGSSRGWRTIGGINPLRADRFRSYLSRRPPDSLTTLITQDDRFRDAETALDAYAEAWALTYYLLRRHPDRFVRYLQEMAEKPPLLYDTPDERLAEFLEAFGRDLRGLDAAFVEAMDPPR